jgi:hypothetical protein
VVNLIHTSVVESVVEPACSKPFTWTRPCRRMLLCTTSRATEW